MLDWAGQVHDSDLAMKEADIRPADLFNEYLRLSMLDAQTFFPPEERSAIPCVACGEKATVPAFAKHGFGYSECPSCQTLYQTPRPPCELFDGFYRQSLSSDFWAEKFFPAMMKNRRELIFVPRVQRIRELCAEKNIHVGTLTEAGAGYGIFLELWKLQVPETQVRAIEPGQKLAAICREKGIEVLESTAEEADRWQGQADLVVCFEVIEHAHNPLTFVKSLFQLVRPGGSVIVSGLGVDGFDIQVLWENSKSISPPHHINFMSVKGFETLFQRAGFATTEVLTPGKLDVDIVRNAAAENPELLNSHRFLRMLLSRGPDAGADFQALLARHRMSSHTWIYATRGV